MFSEKRENWVLRDNLQPVSFCFWISIHGHVLYPVRTVEMERGTNGHKHMFRVVDVVNRSLFIK